jgi:hypothetical protein
MSCMTRAFTHELSTDSPADWKQFGRIMLPNLVCSFRLQTTIHAKLWKVPANVRQEN